MKKFKSIKELKLHSLEVSIPNRDFVRVLGVTGPVGKTRLDLCSIIATLNERITVIAHVDDTKGTELSLTNIYPIASKYAIKFGDPIKQFVKEDTKEEEEKAEAARIKEEEEKAEAARIKEEEEKAEAARIKEEEEKAEAARIKESNRKNKKNFKPITM